MNRVHWEPQDRANVALVKVPYRDTKPATIDRAAREALDHLGGIGKFVKEGQVVAIKPNQSMYKLSSEGVTTSPNLVTVLAKLCRDAGAKEVLVVESSGHGLSTRKMMEITGMAEATREANIEVVYLEEVAQCVVDFGEDAPIRYMPAPEILERVDVFIDCAKAKTHFIDPISGACKNWVGLMPMSFRQWAQREVEPYYQCVAELLKRYRPALTVIDGMVAGEGQGPSANKPFWWGFLVASDDPVAADVTLARAFSLDWEHIRMAREAANMGVGIYDPGRINIHGVALDQATVQVTPCDPSVHRYPCRVIIGNGPAAALEGTLGHWKQLADLWLEDGVWALLTRHGTPTFMFGNADDPFFEEHLKEGPYIVLDDSANDTYKRDPRVIFVPGSPVPQPYIQHDMVKRMGFGQLYEAGLGAQQRATELTGKYTGQAGGKARTSTIFKGIAAAAALAAAVPLVAHYASKRETGE